MYADEIDLFADDQKQPQNLLDISSSSSYFQHSRYLYNTSKCEVISVRTRTFTMNGLEMPSTKCFNNLSVEMIRKGIDYKRLLNRHTSEDICAAEKLSETSNNLGGFPI